MLGFCPLVLSYIDHSETLFLVNSIFGNLYKTLFLIIYLKLYFGNLSILGIFNILVLFLDIFLLRLFLDIFLLWLFLNYFYFGIDGILVYKLHSV